MIASDLLQTALERRALAFCLASRLTAWPSRDFVNDAQRFADALDDAQPCERALSDFARDADAAELEPAYIALFEAGRRCPVHETEYGRMRGMAKGNELADIAGFYAAFGFERASGDEARQMVDHLAVELEFYGTLLVREAALLEASDGEGQAVVRDARRKFLGDHLARLVNAMAAQEAVRADARYGRLLAALATLIADECTALEVEPAPLDFFEPTPESEALGCGALDGAGAGACGPR